MDMRWFHTEEKTTIGKLLEYFEYNQGALITITYENGEQYRCRFCTAYESDNEYAIDEGSETVPIEYFAVALDPIEDICPGPHHSEPGSLIELSYRDFPVRIVSEDGTIIFGLLDSIQPVAI